MLAAMDVMPVSETLPETYRRVLDRVADLDAAGFRREADLVRRDAIRAYSGRWNERTARRVDQLLDHALRVLDGRERPRLAHRSRPASIANWLALAPLRTRSRLARMTRGRMRRHPGIPAEQPSV